MLILNSKDIEKAAHPEGMIFAIKKAFDLYANGNFLMPNRMHINYKDNTLLLMPAFANNYFGTKLVSVFPGNVEQNLAVIQGSFILNNIETGQALALMDGATLTANRTGAVGAFAAQTLTGSKENILGIVGAGVQSFHQALYISQTIRVKEILIFDIFIKKIPEWIKKLQKKLPDVKISSVKNSRDLAEQSDIIVTATTSEKPVLPDDENLYQNKVILAFGSYKPNMKELPDAVFHNTQIFCDTEFAKTESGDLKIPLQENTIHKNQIYNLADILNKKVSINQHKTLIFKSVGMALFDVTVAAFLYEKALKDNLGSKISL